MSRGVRCMWLLAPMQPRIATRCPPLPCSHSVDHLPGSGRRAFGQRQLRQLGGLLQQRNRQRLLGPVRRRARPSARCARLGGENCLCCCCRLPTASMPSAAPAAVPPLLAAAAARMSHPPSLAVQPLQPQQSLRPRQCLQPRQFLQLRQRRMPGRPPPRLLPRTKCRLQASPRPAARAPPAHPCRLAPAAAARPSAATAAAAEAARAAAVQPSLKCTCMRPCQVRPPPLCCTLACRSCSLPVCDCTAAASMQHGCHALLPRRCLIAVSHDSPPSCPPLPLAQPRFCSRTGCPPAAAPT